MADLRHKRFSIINKVPQRRGRLDPTRKKHVKLSALFPLATGERSVFNRKFKNYENSKLKKFD